MEEHTCYICKKTMKYYEPKEDPYFNSDKKRPDDVSGLGTSPSFYHYKTGIFSSESIYICQDYSSNVITGCSQIAKDLIGKGTKGLVKLNSLTMIKGKRGSYLARGAKEFIDENIENGTFDETIKQLYKERENRLKEIGERIDNKVKRKKLLTDSIINLLKEKAVKMPASDIDAFLKHQNVDEIKELCEDMYHNSEISRTANYRYFILTEEKKKPKKNLAPKSEAVDVKAELKKYKEMLDEGLITQEAYDAKMNQLLGL